MYRPASRILRIVATELRTQAKAEAEDEAAEEMQRSEKELRRSLIEHQLWLADFDIERSLEIIGKTRNLAVVESFICYFERIEALKQWWLENPDADLPDVEAV